jgi:preprotein translocase subunit SecD
MKTILYLLVAILMVGNISMSFIKETNSGDTLIIQPINDNLSRESLKLSANIISTRLRSYGTEKFEITLLPEENQIKLVLDEKWDIRTVEELIIQRGELSFYETYNEGDLSELFNGDKYIYSLFRVGNADTQNTGIGCCSVSEMDSINSFLNSMEKSPKCLFAWSKTDEDSGVCLYALKLDETFEALLIAEDIESASLNQDSAAEGNAIEIRFKKSVVDKWLDATKRNINKPIVIVLDNTVLFAPVIKSEISDGVCLITGRFTQREAAFLISIMGSGELPCSFNIVR